MTPETKKTLIYGGVISFAVGVALYMYSRYVDGNGNNSNSASATTNAQQAEEVQAMQNETNLAELSTLGTSGVSLSEPSLGVETPHDNFSQEIASILQAAGLSSSTESAAPTPTAPTAPTSSLPQPAVPVTSGTPVAVSGQPAFRTTTANHNNVLLGKRVVA